MAKGTLFAADFLDRGIGETADWRDLDDAGLDAVAGRLRAHFADYPRETSPVEAHTEERLLYPAMQALGWQELLPQERLSPHGRRDVPDALFFLHAEARRAAEDAGPDVEAKFRLGTLVFEAKRWQLPLDRASGRDTPPSAQLLTYLDRAGVLSDFKLRWGVLTNGRTWRLYDRQAKSPLIDYYEEDLGTLVGFPPAQEDLTAPRDDNERRRRLKTFVLLLRRQAFLAALRAHDARTFHEQALAESRDWEERVRVSLSDTVFDVVYPGLLRALKAADPKAPASPTPAYLDELRNAAFTFLYRLLFALYAEDRNLIPKADPDYDDYSFTGRVRRSVIERFGKDKLSRRRSDLYDHTLKVFETIDQGDSSVGVPPFDGGLFAAGRAALLDRARIPDAGFAPLVHALSLTGDGRQINYRDLSVRELGAVYERLLEREPVADEAAPEGIGVRLNPFARKGSGSYYTPDELVKLIIERSLGPLIEARIETFTAKARGLARSASKRTGADLAALAALDPAAAILALKVCDPAMGSGHFLVALVDHLAVEAFRATEKARLAASEAGIDDYQSPALVEAARTRARIEALARAEGWKLRDDFLSDEAIVRRMALKRCVHGVDKNPMAVELAKVALWLHTLTAGAPLSFLDHHLRCGDSLFGESVRGALDALRAKGALFSHEALRDLDRAAKVMDVIERLTDADLAEARESRARFDEIEVLTRPLTRFLDFWQALKWLDLSRDESRALDSLLDGAFGDPVRVAGGLMEPIRPPGASDETLALFESAGEEQLTLPTELKAATVKDYLALRALIAKAHALARDERFLHWQAAFPGVWGHVNSTEPSGGFDAVIGNPPWDRIKMQEVEWFAARAPTIARQPRAADRKRLIAALATAGDPLFGLYGVAAKRAETAMARARRSGDYPLLSKGDVNLYSLFVERAQALIAPMGIAGLLVPSGIASDLTASAFFKGVATAGRVMCLFDFENKGIFFPDVHNSFKFSCFVVGAAKRTNTTTECAFFLYEMPDQVDSDRRFTLSAADFALVNPNTGTAPIFRTQRDAELSTAIYRRLPILVDRSSGTEVKAWPVKYATMFHMTNDSHLFWTRARLEQEGAYAAPLGRWRKGAEEWLPLYEGKMVQAFDHRAANVVLNVENLHRPAQPEAVDDATKADPDFTVTPQYWVARTAVPETGGPAWALGFKEITAPTNERGMIAALLPQAGYGNKIPILMAERGASSSPRHPVRTAARSDAVQTRDPIQPPPVGPVSAPHRAPSADANSRTQARALRRARDDRAVDCMGSAAIGQTDAARLVACFNAFVFDYVVRFKLPGQTLNWFIVEQLPVVPPAAYDRAVGPLTAAAMVEDHVLRLTYTAFDMTPFARDSGYRGDPFIWNATERRHLRARLDALYFLLYGIEAEDDIRYILSTFPIVARKDRLAHGCYLTAELIVHYKRMFEAGDTAGPYAATTAPETRTPERLAGEEGAALALEATLARNAAKRAA